MAIDKNKMSKCHKEIPKMLEKLIDQLESSNNGYVHGAIGNYYLFNRMVSWTILDDYFKIHNNLETLVFEK